MCMVGAALMDQKYSTPLQREYSSALTDTMHVIESQINTERMCVVVVKSLRDRYLAVVMDVITEGDWEKDG